MKVLIITDLEGVSGVDRAEMMEGEGYAFACERLMADVNAAVGGAFSAGADEVEVVDGHCGGKNFVPGVLDKRAYQLPVSEFVRMPLWGFDALMCVGCHAKAGTEKAFLDHTQSSESWFDYTVNGKSYGEIGQQLICAGAFSVPLVAVCGDEAACAEAKSLVPGVAVAAVKSAEIRNRARCIPGSEAEELIFKAAADGVRRYREIAPYRIETPAELTLTLYRSDYCDYHAANNPSLKRNGRTLTKTVDSVSCYADVVVF